MIPCASQNRRPPRIAPALIATDDHLTLGKALKHHETRPRGTQAARAGAKEIGSKAIQYAEKNVAASLEYAQSLIKARDVTEIMRLHTEYVQNQMRSLAQQASEMGQAMTKAAMDANRPK